MENNEEFRAAAERLRSITAKIEALDREREEAGALLGEVMNDIATKVARDRMEPRRMDGGKAFIMKRSELVDSWSAEYNDWETQAGFLNGFLKKKDPYEWEGIIRKFLSEKDPKVAEAVEVGGRIRSDRYRPFRLNKEFLKEVLDAVWGG